MHFTGCLIKSLQQLKNYYGQVHRGIPSIRLSSYQKKGDLIYFKAFTSASISKSISKSYNSGSGTIMHITSLTGKEITPFSLYSNEKEVIFLPFTYFFIEKIKKFKKYD